MTQKPLHYQLKHYPHFCRLCLKHPDPSTDQMITLKKREDLFHGTIEDYISSITFDTSGKAHLFPQEVCLPCLEILRFHAKYQTKILNISLLFNAFIELKYSCNKVPLEDLFRTKGTSLQELFKELHISNEINAAELIDEFTDKELDTTELNTNGKELEPTELVIAYELTNKELDSTELNTSEKELESTELVIAYELTNKELDSTELNTSEKELESTELVIADKLTDKELDSTELNTNGKELESTEPVIAYEITLDQEIELVHDEPPRDPPFDLPKRRGRPRKKIKTLRCRQPSCTEVYHDRKSFEHHRWTAHKKFICEECGQQSASKHSLDIHIARHRNDEEFQCAYCVRLFNVKKDLVYHIKQIHTEREKFRCEDCGLEYKHKTTFESHLLTHKEEFGFPCTKCDRKFKAKRLLNSHMYRIHSELSYSCDDCGKQFRNRFVLLDHIEKTHKVPMRFLCDICVENFDDENQLKRHKSRHNSPTELECGTCLVLFNSNDQMFNHLCITYQDNYICCGKDHSHHRTYNKHMFVEHGTKVNVRVKPKPNVLQGEMRAKRKPVFTCSKCDEAFSTRLVKKRHEEKCGTNSGDDA